MKKLTLETLWISDAGHAWLAVPESTLKALGIESRISSCSYRGPDGILFLEEDCDAPEFMSAASAAGIKLKIHEKHYNGDDCPIRHLPRY
jgi:hypothetical protein